MPEHLGAKPWENPAKLRNAESDVETVDALRKHLEWGYYQHALFAYPKELEGDRTHQYLTAKFVKSVVASSQFLTRRMAEQGIPETDPV